MTAAVVTPYQKKIIIIAGLIILTLAVYWNVQDFGFVNYDDNLYVTENYQVQSGLTFAGVIEIFSDISTGNWHPLTMISHMLDWELFGQNAGGHHWSSLVIHIINAVLLFLLLNQMTGAIWRSALVAALFAIHPINVESVAWVSERKNVLSTFFWFLTMLFYVWYTRQPHWKRYLPVFICFVLGLMSKSMLVTLPFVLLLMDYWPLNRTWVDTTQGKTDLSSTLPSAKAGFGFLILEKIPLFVLTVIFSVVTLYAQYDLGAVVEAERLPPFERIGNAALAYGLYIKKLIWPFYLSVFYPQYDSSLLIFLILSFCLVLLSIIILRCYRSYPYLQFGWFWYIGTLVPVIGLVQVGHQSMADRYAYVPFVGLFIMLVWFVGSTALINKIIKNIIVLGSICVILTLSVVCWQRCQLWGDQIALWSDLLKKHQLAFAYNFRGLAYAEDGRYDRALKDYHTAIVMDKNFAQAYNNRGNAYVALGQFQNAIDDYEQAIHVQPKYVPTYFNRGRLYLKINKLDAAYTDFTQALSINGNLAEAYYNRGLIFSLYKQHTFAVREYNEALQRKPSYIDAYFGRGTSYLFLGQYNDAIRDFRQVLEVNPRHLPALNNLGLVLQEMGRYEESAEQYRKILQIKPDDHNAREQLKEIAKLERKDKPVTKE